MNRQKTGIRKKNIVRLALPALLAVWFGAGLAGAEARAASADGARPEKRIYVIPLKQEIDRSAMRKVHLGLKEALAWPADAVVLDLNTYGGAVDAADSIRTALLQCPVPVAAFVNVQAASAGALIALACDSVYMRTGSSMGAATVVNQTGAVMPDKYQSFMRGMMRATAEAHGKQTVTGPDGDTLQVWHRDPAVAQQMTDTANVLTLTPEEAMRVRFCEGTAESLDEVAGRLAAGRGYELREQRLSGLHRVILWLMNPFLQSIFLMLIIGGIYFELQTPGIGFPLAAALAGALLYFAPLYLEGLALHWEIALFAVGLLLLALELFVLPGFGVFGIAGILAVFFALIFSMVDNDALYFDGELNLQPVLRPTLVVAVSFLTALVVSVWAAGRLYGTRGFSRIALKTDLKESDGFVGVEKAELDRLVGREALAVTALRPSGKVEVDGRWYDAQLENGMAEAGERVRIVRTEIGRVYAERL